MTQDKQNSCFSLISDHIATLALGIPTHAILFKSTVPPLTINLPILVCIPALAHRLWYQQHLNNTIPTCRVPQLFRCLIEVCLFTIIFPFLYLPNSVLVSS